MVTDWHDGCDIPDMDRDRFVYALADESGIRYVGCSANPGRRLYEHRSGMSGSRSHLIRMDGVRLLILEAVTSSSAEEREIFWIESLCWKQPLVNLIHNKSLRWIRTREDNGRLGSWRFERKETSV